MSSLDVTVPSKIVIVGTSSMSLNERFSNIKPKPAVVTVRPTRKSILSLRKPQTYPVANGGDELVYEDVAEDIDMVEEAIYDPTYAAVSRTRNPVIRRQRLIPMPMYQPSILDRVSFAPVARGRGAFNPNGYSTFPSNRGRAGFRYNNSGFNRNGFRSDNYGRLNNGGGFMQGRGGRGGYFKPRGYGMRGGARGQKQPKQTLEELDRELDQYVSAKSTNAANSKHPQITMN